MTKHPPQFIQPGSQKKEFICQGEWNLNNIVYLKKQLETFTLPAGGDITLDGSAITQMDSAGAWVFGSWAKKPGMNIRLQKFSEQHQKLLSLVENKIPATKKIPTVQAPGWLARTGAWAVQQMLEFREYLNFTGMLAVESLRIFRHPGKIRWRAFINVIDKSGYQALPIIGLLSFMIGVVIAYQMGNQLRNYGANIFIVDLLGLSVLREFGPLLTAIIVAGRTGSAFTAQIGTMQINQEIDALDTMGVTPAELLLLPRLAGLFIALPLLTVWADIMGVAGGMLMAKTMLGVTPYDFLQRFQHAIPVRSLIIGLGKAPVFALLIASIGCFQGMQVRGSADSVGKNTTRSVVLAIFFIIIIDAIFSVIFSELKL